MTSWQHRERPPLAKALPSAIEPFGALLASALDDPSAAQGLALAYAELDRARRQMLIDAVLSDARAAGLPPSIALASMLGVEDDADTARYLAAAIAAAGGAGLRCHDRCRAFLAGDAGRGAALLSRPLYGRFVEVLGLVWVREHGVVRTLFEPLVNTADLTSWVRALRWADGLEEMPIGFALDTVAMALWRHRRRHGELPELVRRFADLFDPAGIPQRE